MSNSSAVVVKVQLVSWMREVHPFNKTDELFYMLGKAIDQPGFVVVVDGTRGGAWFYCAMHNAVFAITGRCPMCMGAEVETPNTDCEAAPEAPATPF